MNGGANKILLAKPESLNYLRPVIRDAPPVAEGGEDYVRFADGKLLPVPKDLIAFSSDSIFITVQPVKKMFRMNAFQVEEEAKITPLSSVEYPWIVLFDGGSGRIFCSFHNKYDPLPPTDEVCLVDIGATPNFRTRFQTREEDQFLVGGTLILNAKCGKGKKIQRVALAVKDGTLGKVWQHSVANNSSAKPVWLGHVQKTTATSSSVFITSKVSDFGQRTTVKLMSKQGASIARQILEGDQTIIGAFSLDEEAASIHLLTRGRIPNGNGSSACETVRVYKFGQQKPVTEFSGDPTLLCLPKALHQPFKGDRVSVSCDGGRTVFWSLGKLLGDSQLQDNDFLPTKRSFAKEEARCCNSLSWQFWTHSGRTELHGFDQLTGKLVKISEKSETRTEDGEPCVFNRLEGGLTFTRSLYEEAS